MRQQSVFFYGRELLVPANFLRAIATCMMTGVLLGFYPSVSVASQPKVCGHGHCVSVEIAKTPEELRRGLMGRASLGKNKGMLFVFDTLDTHAFWMKNMKFSLDLLWLDEQGKIVELKANVPACDQEQCPTIKPAKQAMYVLEVQAGQAQVYGWRIGDVLHEASSWHSQ